MGSGVDNTVVERMQRYRKRKRDREAELEARFRTAVAKGVADTLAGIESAGLMEMILRQTPTEQARLLNGFFSFVVSPRNLRIEAEGESFFGSHPTAHVTAAGEVAFTVDLSAGPAN